jgi:hypothetical protein
MGKQAWRWGPSEELSFRLLRVEALTTALMHGFDWSLPARLYTDASGYGIGVAVVQL